MPIKGLSHLHSRVARQTTPSVIRDICALVAQPGIRSLAGGWPDPAVFPYEDVAAIFSDLIKEHGSVMLQYGSTEGLPELRQAIIERMAAEGMPGLGLDNIVITHGSAQAMSLSAQVFINPGEALIVGLPTYFGGPGSTLAREGKLIGVPIDAEGMNTDALAETLARAKGEGQVVKGAYVIPNFQNPTGVTWTLARREGLLKLAQEYDLVIFEDDPYRDLRFEGESLPSLFQLSGGERVLQFRSLSKTFAPGLRLGWAAGAAEDIRQLSVAKQYQDAGTNVPAQFIVLEYMRRGLFDRRIADNVAFYRKKRDYILSLLDKHFPKQVTWNRPQGGFFLFVHLPEGLDGNQLFQEAAREKVAFVAGQPFFVDGSGANTIRLSYSQASKEEMAGAIETLGQLLKKKLGQ